MDLSYAEVGYFITQVGLSAASFGVATDDITLVGEALAQLFDFKCSPPVELVKGKGAKLQSICTGDGCPLDPNAVCAQYQIFSEPTSVMPSATATSSMMASGTIAASATGSKPASASTAAAAGAALPASLALFGAAIAYLL
jgi:hypothetical protein